MAFEMDAPENQEQEGPELKEAGKYHCAVLSIDENPTTNEGKLIDNAVFRADCCVLDGTTRGQQKKEMSLLFFGPKMTDKDHGEMARKKIMFFAKSVGCLTVAGGKMTIDFAQAGGRQFVCEIEMRESEKNGKKYRNPSLVYCNVWHVDDPAVKDVPKDVAALGLLPPALRKTAADFERKPPAGGSNCNTAGQTAKTPPAQPHKPAAGAVDLNDL